VYVADSGTIRKISSNGVVVTIAGTAGVTNSVDGVGSEARFGVVGGIAVDPLGGGTLYVTDWGAIGADHDEWSGVDDCWEIQKFGRVDGQRGRSTVWTEPGWDNGDRGGDLCGGPRKRLYSQGWGGRHRRGVAPATYLIASATIPDSGMRVW